MAYLILSDHQGEFDRRELKQAVVIGRALDCDICVRDILLSRKHCRIEPFNDRWVVADLGSKNGTRVETEVITRHVLSDGEVVKIGKIQISFRAGAFVAPATNSQRRRDVRPSDPTEALSGTVLGFQLFDMEEDSRVSGFPIPKPKPAEPASMRQDSVHSMVAQIASTAWDVSSTSAAKPAATKTAKKPPQEIIKRNQQIARAKAVAAVAAASNVQSISKPQLETRPAPVALADPLSPSVPAAARSKSPEPAATIPTWLACFYLLLACALGAGSVALIVMRSQLWN